MLRRCNSNPRHQHYPDPTHVLDWAELLLGEDVSYEEQHIHIIERKDHVLRGRVIPLVRIQWNHHNIVESTREDENEVRKSYPHLFPE